MINHEIRIVDDSTATLLFSINQQILEKLTKEQKEEMGKEIQKIIDYWADEVPNESLPSQEPVQEGTCNGCTMPLSNCICPESSRF